MRLVLHIGTEKTATTTIQQFLYLNRDKLAAQGIGLSNVLGWPNNRKLAAYCLPPQHFDDYFQANNIRTTEEKDEHFLGFTENFAREVAALSEFSDTMIISGEHLHSRLRLPYSFSRLRDLLKPLFSRVEIVCYFREQSAVVKSLYSTAIKSGSTKEFSEIVADCTPENRYYNFDKLFQQWGETFGQEMLTGRLYDRDSFYGNDIRSDFLHVAKPGIVTDDFAFPAEASNSSLGLAGLKLGLINNRINPRFDSDIIVRQRRKLILTILENSSIALEGELPFVEAKNIYDAFDESNTSFARRFLNLTTNPFPPPKLTVADQENFPSIPLPQVIDFFKKILLTYDSSKISKPELGERAAR